MMGFTADMWRTNTYLPTYLLHSNMGKNSYEVNCYLCSLGSEYYLQYFMMMSYLVSDFIFCIRTSALLESELIKTLLGLTSSMQFRASRITNPSF